MNRNIDKTIVLRKANLYGNYHVLITDTQYRGLKLYIEQFEVNSVAVSFLNKVFGNYKIKVSIDDFKSIYGLTYMAAENDNSKFTDHILSAAKLSRKKSKIKKKKEIPTEIKDIVNDIINETMEKIGDKEKEKEDIGLEQVENLSIFGESIQNEIDILKNDGSKLEAVKIITDPVDENEINNDRLIIQSADEGYMMKFYSYVTAALFWEVVSYNQTEIVNAYNAWRNDELVNYLSDVFSNSTTIIECFGNVHSFMRGTSAQVCKLIMSVYNKLSGNELSVDVLKDLKFEGIDISKFSIDDITALLFTNDEESSTEDKFNMLGVDVEKLKYDLKNAITIHGSDKVLDKFKLVDEDIPGLTFRNMDKISDYFDGSKVMHNVGCGVLRILLKKSLNHVADNFPNVNPKIKNLVIQVLIKWGMTGSVTDAVTYQKIDVALYIAALSLTMFLGNLYKTKKNFIQAYNSLRNIEGKKTVKSSLTCLSNGVSAITAGMYFTMAAMEIVALSSGQSLPLFDGTLTGLQAFSCMSTLELGMYCCRRIGNIEQSEQGKIIDYVVKKNAGSIINSVFNGGKITAGFLGNVYSGMKRKIGDVVGSFQSKRRKTSTLEDHNLVKLKRRKPLLEDDETRKRQKIVEAHRLSLENGDIHTASRIHNRYWKNPSLKLHFVRNLSKYLTF